MSALAFVRKALPWLGTVASIAGVPGAAPIVAIASKILSKNLSVPVTPESFEKVLTGAFGDPAQQAAALAADREFQKAMQEMGYAHEAEMEEIAEKDRESARATQVQTRSLTLTLLAWAAVITLPICIYLIGFKPMQPSGRDALLLLMGAVISTYKDVYGYFFGSSAGSARKTELLAQS